jgi:hypothetical protein
MHPAIGFASGCFTATDYDLALSINDAHGGTAFELGCYQTAWLSQAESWARRVPPGRIPLMSVHTPRFTARQEPRVADILGSLGLPMIVHADRVGNPALWRLYGPATVIENIADPARFGSTAESLDTVFARLPEASFCLDVSHAFGAGGPDLVRELARRYRDRLTQLHVGCVGVPVWPGDPLPADAALVRSAWDSADKEVPVIVERPFPEVGVSEAARCDSLDAIRRTLSAVRP